MARGTATFERAFEGVAKNIETVIQGNHEAIRLALVCMVAEGHLLIEDVPGVGQDHAGQGAGHVARL